MCTNNIRLSLKSATQHIIFLREFFDVDPKCGMMCKFRVIRYHLTDVMTAGP